MNVRLSANYKGIAREKLLGRYSTVIGAILIMQLIFMGVSYVTDAVVDNTTVTGMVIYLAILAIVGLISAVFAVGELTLYMKLSCGDKISVWDIFAGFTGHPDKAIILQFNIAVRCLVFWLPFIGIMAYMTVSGMLSLLDGIDVLTAGNNRIGTEYILMLALFAVVGAIGSVYIRILYSQVFYMLIDHPEYETGEIMDKSRKLITGHMWDYLYINISFIPIILLGLLSLGVGLMYIQPYRGVTLTQFYLDLASGELDRGRNIDVAIDDRSMNLS